ncbi:uncharacterized protein LOC112690171 [Sipha flava]|uniref:Uncharacterized protein LOC112690171 n=1 Tax=Sipha flava TaxID=143950 RepID=A0A8B8GAW0_9HEMI|nr:uncharacterized protein LOC112690171 [Sipha flava]
MEIIFVNELRSSRSSVRIVFQQQIVTSNARNLCLPTNFIKNTNGETDFLKLYTFDGRVIYIARCHFTRIIRLVKVRLCTYRLVVTRICLYAYRLADRRVRLDGYRFADREVGLDTRRFADQRVRLDANGLVDRGVGLDTDGTDGCRPYRAAMAFVEHNVTHGRGKLSFVLVRCRNTFDLQTKCSQCLFQTRIRQKGKEVLRKTRSIPSAAESETTEEPNGKEKKRSLRTYRPTTGTGRETRPA